MVVAGVTAALPPAHRRAPDRQAIASHSQTRQLRPQRNTVSGRSHHARRPNGQLREGSYLDLYRVWERGPKLVERIDSSINTLLA
jgi:hypothetical protein